MGLFDLLAKDTLLDEKEEVIQKIKAAGFKATKKMKIGPVLFAIDQNSQCWLVLDDRFPQYTIVHRFQQIKGAKIIKESQTISNRSGSSHRIMGVRLSSGQRITRKVYTKLGVLVELNNLNCPTQYIDCLSAPGSEETILSIIKSIMDSQK